jgi:hypothetical protein
MPHQQTITIAASNESLDLTWEENWRNFTITQNGKVICQLKDYKELKVARRAVTAAGRVVVFLLNQDDFLEIWCNGRELISGSVSGDINYIAKACGAIRFCGYSYIVVGSLFAFEFPTGVSVILIAVGGICHFLAWQAKRTGKKIYLQMALFPCIVAIPFGRPIGGILRADIMADISKGIEAAKD